jgi:heme/copper-type cytochrome/quinol oxidase subunit 2
MTIRFLLKYMSRPLHFFGGIGMVAMLSGGGVGAWLAIQKILNPSWDVMEEHGPLVVFAAVLILAGIQLLAFGLLGEMQVRYHHESRRAPYALERVLRSEERERSRHSE